MTCIQVSFVLSSSIDFSSLPVPKANKFLHGYGHVYSEYNILLPKGKKKAKCLQMVETVMVSEKQ